TRAASYRRCRRANRYPIKPAITPTFSRAAAGPPRIKCAFSKKEQGHASFAVLYLDVEGSARRSGGRQSAVDAALRNDQETRQRHLLVDAARIAHVAQSRANRARGDESCRRARATVAGGAAG